MWYVIGGLCYIECVSGKTYIENGSCTTEDEVDGTLDVTLMVVMSTFVTKNAQW